MDEEHVVDRDEGDGNESIDATPRDRLEREAKGIEAPGVSKRPLEKVVSTGGESVGRGEC